MWRGLVAPLNILNNIKIVKQHALNPLFGYGKPLILLFFNKKIK